MLAPIVVTPSPCLRAFCPDAPIEVHHPAPAARARACNKVRVGLCRVRCVRRWEQRLLLSKTMPGRRASWGDAVHAHEFYDGFESPIFYIFPVQFKVTAQ